jgi:hypothetical protein
VREIVEIYVHGFTSFFNNSTKKQKEQAELQLVMSR